MFKNKFNQLYNLIMQDRTDQFLPRLKKYKVKYPDFDIDKALKDLLSLPSKESKLACTLLVNDEIKSIDDDTFKLYKDILKSYPNVDINSISEIKKLLNKRSTKNKNNQIQSLYKDLDKRFDCLTKKDQYDNDLVVYTIRDDRDAMRQIRQIVDAFKGSKTIVWCLVKRQANGDMDQGWSNWIKYNAYPKQIAFQKGKLIGFNANESKQNLWWDIQDRQLKDGLVDLYGKVVKVKESKPYNDSNRTKLTIKQLEQLEKDKNGFYYTNGDFSITNDCVVDGKLPIKLAYVGGSFKVNGCISLTSIENFPKKVGGEVSCKQCDGIPFRQLKNWLKTCK